MIRILTIEREFGSGGHLIARRLADRLGWALWDQRFTDEIARRLDCDTRSVEAVEERPDPAYYRLLRAFLRGAFEANVNTPRMRAVDTDCVREIAQSVVLDIAEAGRAVVVGRGSALYLSDRPDAFHVFVYAPFESKVRRLKADGKSDEEAARLSETVDRDRAAFIRRYFHLEWPSIHRFHLMVNSAMGEDIAAETILDAMARYGRERA
jgi:cytidylate kinase